MKNILKSTLFALAALTLVAPVDAQNGRTKKLKTASAKPMKKEAVPMVVYTESYGSVCCPKDPNWDKELFTDYVKRFNEENHVTIQEIYNQARGREGEQIYAVTLVELNPALKKKFVRNRMKERAPQTPDRAKDMLANPKPLSDFIQGDLPKLKIQLN